MSTHPDYGPAPSFTYMPALDGMRALCILMVMISHYGMPTLLPGGLGVTVFFFISGFLITRQLLAERASTGRIDLIAFTLRRQCRLYPALLVMILLSGFGFMALGGAMQVHRWLAAFFYYYNYFDLTQMAVANRDSPFNVLWSLAVEEHYYLVFPFLVFLLGTCEKRFARILLLAIVAVTLWRGAVASSCSVDGALCWGDPQSQAEAATDTRLDSILYGAWLATALAADTRGRLLRLLCHPVSVALGLLLLALSLATRDELFRQSLRYTLQGIALTPLVSAVLFNGDFHLARTALSHPLMRLAGRLSYSLYLWHWTLAVALLQLRFGAVDPHTPQSALLLREAAPALIILSFAVAALSYYGVERPMLALRRRFGSHAVAERSLSTAPALPAE